MDMRRSNISNRQGNNGYRSPAQRTQSLSSMQYGTQQSTPRAAAATQPRPQAAPKPAAPPAATAPTATSLAAQAARAQAPARAYLSAYVKDFHVAPTAKGAAIPLEPQRAEGGFAVRRGAAVVPADGYYMILWEVGITQAGSGANLYFGINQSVSQISYTLQPGYDSGQQVTWLSENDRLSLQLRLEGEPEGDVPEVQGSSAQLTVLRMG